MFCCISKPRRKNADKIEGMASWLILGGVLPLAVTVIIQHRIGITFDIFTCLYLWGIAMCITSLGVKRASPAWQLIVALGAAGFGAAAVMNMLHFQASSLGTIIWPFTVLAVIFLQFRRDMTIDKKKES